MYDWIPMEFDYDILISHGGNDYAHYDCISNDENRESFHVFKDGDIVLSSYSRSALIDAMEFGSKINGMTMDELKDSYYIGNEESTIDIGSLI